MFQLKASEAQVNQEEPEIEKEQEEVLTPESLTGTRKGGQR